MDLDKFKSLHKKFNRDGLHYTDLSGPEFEEYQTALHEDMECFQWHLASILEERGFDSSNHCCLLMAYHLSTPNTMPEGEDDSDIIVKYNEIFDEYGIPIYDGGASVVQIDYCPWCGHKLPESKRDRWFEELRQQGIEDVDNQIPEQYQSDQWWRNPK